ncbi:MAG TPA: AMP-binding protein [Nocardioidaceae bacterium]|nr:AMP-binding protein [Nocardioidaceae bacterium]
MHVEIRQGDRIALLVAGSTAYVDLVIGLLAAGMFPVPLDPALTARERADVLAYVDPRLVVDSQEQLASVVAHTPERFRRGLPRCRPMHLTSGTTGARKGVWSGVLDEPEAEALLGEERDLWGFCESDVNLVLSPLYHSAPLRFAIGTVLAGGRLVVPGERSLRSERSERLEGFDPAVITETITRERPTTMFCVPTHLQRLFAHWDRAGAPDLGSFRLVAHAGAPCPPAVKERLVELFPDGSTWEFYGSTEGQFTACRSEEQLTRPGTVGRARPGRALSTDEDGTIWCTVPGHARFNYWNAPEKTAAAWRNTEHGSAFTVGDVGRLDDDGYLYLDGRREDLVISGGVNVYPVEVENALRGCAGLEDVAVFGVSDEQWGQRVCAVVVGTAEPAALSSYVRERLSPAKRPKDYYRLDELPRTTTGKVRRLELPGLLGLE